MRAPELERRVYLESEGLPLFVAEYLAALRAGGEPAEEPLPTEVRSVLDARLGGLGDVARQVLGAAAAIGRSFDLDTVRQASGRSDEETVGALEELVAQGVVREAPGPEPVYDFSHQKLRALVYEQTEPRAAPPAPRARGGRAVEAAAGRGERGARRCSTCAWPATTRAQRSSYRLAAEHAASLHAHADALEHLEAALALGDPDAARLARAHRRPAHAARRLRRRSGELRERRRPVRAAGARGDRAQAGRRAPPPRRMGARGGALPRRARRGARRRSGGCGRASRPTSPSRCTTPAGPSARRHSRARPSRSPRPRPIVAPRRRRTTCSACWPGTRASSQPRSMQLERSLALARELRDDPAQAAALNNLALVKRDAGELAEALALTESALALCAAYGDRHREAALENNLADLHHAAGDDDDAMVHLKRAVAIFTEVGADEATRLPEIWKLVSW